MTSGMIILLVEANAYRLFRIFKLVRTFFLSSMNSNDRLRNVLVLYGSGDTDQVEINLSAGGSRGAAECGRVGSAWTLLESRSL